MEIFYFDFVPVFYHSYKIIRPNLISVFDQWKLQKPEPAFSNLSQGMYAVDP